MNWLFLTFLFATGCAAVYTRRALHPRDEPRVGPVPGYTARPGDVFALDPIPHLERGSDWWPELLEEFHSRDRTRLVLRFGVRSRIAADDVRSLLEVCAREVAERASAHVVYVEAHTDGRLRGVYLWAPDGRGWSGVDDRSVVWFPGADPPDAD